MVEFTLYSVSADLHVSVNLAAEFSFSGMTDLLLKYMLKTINV